MIELKELTKKYDGRSVVKKVSFSVEPGEAVALVGGSGSGKTTTLKMINRLIEPTSGSVVIDGRDTKEFLPHVLRRKIGCVFQKIGLFPHMTIGDNIAVPMKLADWDNDKIDSRIHELLKMVSLEKQLCSRKPRELSDGQQQRVGVARALAIKPTLMLLDEPFGALDPIIREQLQQTFLAIKKNLNLSAIFVTHDISEAIMVADRIAVMNDGEILQLGSPQDLIKSPKDPYVEQLLDTPRRQTKALEEIFGGKRVIEQLQFLPFYLISHINLTLTSLIVGVVISVPLGIIASRVPLAERITLGVAGAIQTVPSLALLAAMVPLLAFLGAPSIGYFPAFIALVLYCMLPILRNTVVGLKSVDPSYIEAAKGVGMTSLQRLFRVELPLALPMIFAGIRTSTIWTVGTATLSTPVGAASLGNYIFIGLQTRNTDAILIGCTFAALLAFVLDGLVRALAIGIERKIRVLVIFVFSLLMAFYLSIGWTFFKDFIEAPRAPITVGAKGFSEQYILSEIMAQAIENEHSLPVRVRQSLGTSIAFDALAANDIDIYTEYTGTIWTHLMKRSDPLPDPDILSRDIDNFLAQFGITVVGSFGFNNTYSMAMKRADSERLGIERLSDLARHRNLKIGADYEFFGRPEWEILKKSYDLDTARQIPMDHGLMFQAIDDNSVDVIVVFSTDGHIKAHDLVVLKDDKNVALSYHALIVANKNLFQIHPQTLSMLKKLTNSIDEKSMQQMNLRVDQDKVSPSRVAKDFLKKLGLGELLVVSKKRATLP